VTAHARPEDRQRAEKAGYDQYLPKPVERGALVNAVAALANGVERQAALNSSHKLS
jgi:CheY-like chemotaxis protein